MKADSDSDYKFIAVALILALVFSLAYILSIRDKPVQGEEFTELYVEGTDFPADMRVNQTYNVSFTLTNRGADSKAYIYEVDSRFYNLSETLTLDSGESASIVLSVTPLETAWDVSWYVDHIRLDYFEGMDDLTLDVLAFDVSGFGEILHENVTIEELKTKPLTSFSEREYRNLSVSGYESINRTLSADETGIALRTHERIIRTMSAKKPFIIRVYEVDAEKGEELELYFWHEVR